MHKILIAFSMAACMAFIACERRATETTTTTTQQETDTRLHQEEMRAERDREVMERRRRLDEIDTIIVVQDRRYVTAPATVRQEWEREREELRRESRRLRQELDRAGDRADSEWDNFWNNVGREVDTLGARIDRWATRNFEPSRDETRPRTTTTTTTGTTNTFERY